MHVLPPRGKRQAHQDALDTAARGIQSKSSPAVMHEIELNIAPAPDLLPLLLLLGEGEVLAALDDGDVGRQERGEAVLHEGEQLLLVLLGLVQVIEEDAADAARLASVLVVEVFVTPFLEARVVQLVVLVAGRFDGVVKMDCVFVEEVARREVGSAAVPPCVCVACLVGCLEVAVVEMHGRCHGVGGVEDQAQACGEERE